MTTLHKTVIAAVIFAAISAGIYQAQQASTLQNQVEGVKRQQELVDSSNNDVRETLQGKADLLASSNAALAGALAQANAEKTGLEAEREQAKHCAALFKELAEWASSKESNSTNDYPTRRHVWAGWGRIGRLGAEFRKDDGSLSSEEKAANQAVKMNALVEFASLMKAVRQFEMEDSSAAESARSVDPSDCVTCLLYGALKLNEYQFSQIYGVLEKYRQQAKQEGLFEDNPPAEKEAALKSLIEKAQGEIRGALTPDQTSLFEAISPNLKIGLRKFDFNFNFQ